MTMEDRLRQAITEQVATVPCPQDRWADIEARGAATRRSRYVRRRVGTWAVLGLVAAAVAAVVSVPLLTNQPTNRIKTRPAGPSPASSRPGPTVPLAPATTVIGPAATTVTAPAATGPAGFSFAYPPMWPFRTQAEARAWEASYRAGAHQPWHLDPAQTAMSFTNGYLGYTDINKVVRQTVGATEARVAVGFDNPSGQPFTAAVIHLVRFDAGPDGPWEVVGTDDTNMSTTFPAYGSVVSSPVTVGGIITGVDESISVEVLQPSSASPLGRSCCLPAGGNASPWRVTVSFQGATDPVLTIAAATGGHLQTVERFTVTAVRTGR